MKADRRGWWLLIGVAGVALATACGSGNGGEETGGSRTAQEASTSAVTGPVTPTTVATTPVTGATVPDPDQAYESSPVTAPSARATPPRAPAGTRVRLEGDGFTDEKWQGAGGSLWLSDARQQGECVVLAEAEHDVTVTGDGHLSGTFVVPDKGQCRFSTGEVDTGTLRYDIAYQCIDCHIGSFTVILAGESTEEPAGTRCVGTVVFGVQDFAGDINADGVSCDQAESFIRAHAGPWRPESGPAHFEAEGFSCDRTGRSETALPPRANYKCTRGSEAIWFIRQ